MKNRIITNSLRTIKTYFSRFIPLFVMSFLGVFVYSGLQSVKPDMIKTLDNYWDEHNIYDVKIVSTGGLVNEDLEYIKSIEGIKDAELSFSIDKVINVLENDIVVNISSLPKNINTVKLLKGRLPNNNKEIVVEENFIEKTNYNIGDVLNLESDNLVEKEYKIVGTIESGLYINNDDNNQNRGRTNVGTGTINYYSYVLDSSFNQKFYNSCYITIEGAKDLITSDTDYIKKVDEVIDRINLIKENREKSRYDSLYKEIDEEIKKNEDEVNVLLEDGEKLLNDAKKELDNNKILLDKNKRTLNNTKSKLDSAKNELDNANKKYNDMLSIYNIKESEIDSSIKSIMDNITYLKSIINNIPSDSIEYQEYLKRIQELENNYNNLLKLNNVRKEINEAIEKYNIGLNKYNEGIKLYNDGYKKYEDGVKKYNKEKESFIEEKEETLNKINDAKIELSNLEVPTWMINSRSDYQTYTDYVDDTTSINNLSKIFPSLFFIVAILVSLISMNRMVLDDRGEIGTLKSLGFVNKDIMIKYLLFSSIATILGGLLGGILGILVLPSLIFSIYGILFDVPNFYIGLNLGTVIVSLIISVLCICGATVITVLKVVREKPADLMRPKAPKAGKEILLEKWHFFWKRLSFSNKVTLRNIFRYKKRGIVTIIGIAGCSALMLCGFGIRDAIVDIANMQYKNTFIYDAMVYVNNPIKYNQAYINGVVEAKNINVWKDKTSLNMLVLDKDDVDKVVNLEDKAGNKLKLETGKVIITDKFADINNLSVGDTIEFRDDVNKTYKYEISGITKNYLMHYIYIDKDTYNKDNKFKPNVMYLDLDDIDSLQKDELTKYLMDNEDVLSVIFIDEMLNSANDMLASLNKVVFIIIILSASLSFVVLYNLSNININERKREISTLKVLGFYDKEVDNYITKDNIAFTILGIILGLFIGYFLTRGVIMTVEMEKARFLYQISFASYIYTTLITISFTFIVNFVTHFNLKKIDMIGSLKSVE